MADYNLNDLENNHSRPNENTNGNIKVSTMGDTNNGTSECTILDYFSMANTYDPFIDANSLQYVENLDFIIPKKSSLESKEYLDVTTGLLCTSISFLNYCNFQIIDRATGKKITDLVNVMGEIGNKVLVPKANQIFWFNRDGLKGTYYINTEHKGQILRIVNGQFSTTAVTSSVLKELVYRTVGVPAYIKRIQQRLDEQDARITQKFIEIDNLMNTRFAEQNARIEQYRNELVMTINALKDALRGMRVYSLSYLAANNGNRGERCNVNLYVPPNT